MKGPPAPRDKHCAHCGRTFSWRKKWARDWDQVRHCSAACRRGRLPVDRALDAIVLALLAERGAGATICPSDVARRAGRGDWRTSMPRVREAVARLEAAGEVWVTQGGERVAFDDAPETYRVVRGPATGVVPASRGVEEDS